VSAAAGDRRTGFSASRFGADRRLLEPIGHVPQRSSIGRIIDSMNLTRSPPDSTKSVSAEAGAVHTLPAKIREEVPADVPAIEAVTVAAFLNAVHTSHSEQYIVNALRRAGALSISLVAEIDGVLVGHVALSPVNISDGSAHWFGLGPISVLPAHQRGGVGSTLMQAALAALRQRNAQGCVLLGDPSYYGRFGFRASPDLVLPGVPPEYFQTLYLGPTTPRGIVTYHPAFEATS